MKTVIYIMLSLFYMSCIGQNIQDKVNNKKAEEGVPIDTVSILLLQNKQYDPFNYAILQLRLSDLDELGYRINKIELTKDDKAVASIVLPNSEDVKNFSVSKMEETKIGFKIVVDWGGGNYFYGREFYFTFKDNQFYLDSLKMSYLQEPKEETRATKKINPPISIDKFDIISYLDNE